MAKTASLDLRERVVGAVEDGASRCAEAITAGIGSIPITS